MNDADGDGKARPMSVLFYDDVLRDNMKTVTATAPAGVRNQVAFG